MTAQICVQISVVSGVIVIESPEKLTDSNLEEIVDMWNRKGRQIAV